MNIMGRRPCYSKMELRKDHWTSQEDQMLMDYVRIHGEGKWRDLAKKTGLKRCGKSCRLRWLNYLRPGLKLGNISEDEEDLIIKLHRLLGNRWTLIAGRLPGRSGNEIKNYWNSTLSKKILINNNADHPNLDGVESEEKKAEDQKPEPPASTTSPPSKDELHCNDQPELIHSNDQTCFGEYNISSIMENDDLMGSFWNMDSYEIEFFSSNHEKGRHHHQQQQEHNNNAEAEEALGDYDLFSFDIFS